MYFNKFDKLIFKCTVMSKKFGMNPHTQCSTCCCVFVHIQRSAQHLEPFKLSRQTDSHYLEDEMNPPPLPLEGGGSGLPSGSLTNHSNKGTRAIACWIISPNATNSGLVTA